MKGIFGSSILKGSAKNSNLNLPGTQTVQQSQGQNSYNPSRLQLNGIRQEIRGYGGGGGQIMNIASINSQKNDINYQTDDDRKSSIGTAGIINSKKPLNLDGFSFHEEIMLLDSKGNNGQNIPTSEDLNNYLINGQKVMRGKQRNPNIVIKNGGIGRDLSEFHQSRAMNQTGVVIFRKDNNKRMQTEPVMDKLDHIPPLILKPTQVFSNASTSKRPETNSLLPTPQSNSANNKAKAQSQLADYQKQSLGKGSNQLNMTHSSGAGAQGMLISSGEQTIMPAKILGTQSSMNMSNKGYNMHIQSAEDVIIGQRKIVNNKINEIAAMNALNEINNSYLLSQQQQSEIIRQQFNMSTPLASTFSQSRQILNGPNQVHLLFDPTGSQQMTAGSMKHQKLYPHHPPPQQPLSQQQQIVQSIQMGGETVLGMQGGTLGHGVSGTQLVKSQKPPISSGSHNSQVGTPSDHHKRGQDNNQQNGGGNKFSKNANNNKRIAISITQVGLNSANNSNGGNFGGPNVSGPGVNMSQGSNQKPKQSIHSNSNGFSNQEQIQVLQQIQHQQIQGGNISKNVNDHRHQRFSNTMVSRGQSLPPDKIGSISGVIVTTNQTKEESIFQLPEVNSKQSHLQQIQSVQSTPIPRPKKQTIIIPNNTFHYVVGQSQMNNSAPNQLLQSQAKYHSAQKINPNQTQTTNMFNQSYAARFGFVVNPIEAAQRKKAAQFKNIDNNPLMINMLQSQNQTLQQQNSQIEETSEHNFYYAGQNSNSIGEDTSNPLGFSPMIKKIGDNSVSYGPGFSNSTSPLKLTDDQRMELQQQQYLYQQNTPQNQRTQAKNQKLQSGVPHILAPQHPINSESPKKDVQQFSNLKPRIQKENQNQRIQQQYQDMMGNIIDPKGSYVIEENGISEGSEDDQGSPPVNNFNLHSGKKLRQQDSNEFGEGGFDYNSPPMSGTFDNSKMENAANMTKYQQFEIHGQHDPDRNFSAHVQSLYATTNSQSDSAFNKSQPGFAVRKGQLVKTQNINQMGVTQTGGQWISAQKQIRVSSEDQGISPNGKSGKKKEGSPSKNKKQKLEQAFQSILNQRAERLGAVKNYMQVYQKKQPANFLNIQKIGAPNASNNGGQNRNLQSRDKFNTENTNRQKQSILQKIAQGFRQNIVQEKYMEPETPAKFGLTKRLMFKRRLRMKEKNVVIIYFDGVIGDVPYNQGQALGYNNFRVRAGSIKELQQLCYQSQVVLVMPYNNKRSQVIAKYLFKFSSCSFDAVYSCRAKETRSTKKGYLRKWQDYQQIYRDFNLDEPHQIIEQCLVIGCYTTEIELINERSYNFDVDISRITNIKYPELQGVACLRARNEIENIRMANPSILLVPHMDLDLGSICSFQTIVNALDQMRNTNWQALIHHQDKASGGNHNNHHKSPPHKNVPSQNHHQHQPLHHQIVANVANQSHLQPGHQNHDTVTRSHSHSGIQQQQQQTASHNNHQHAAESQNKHENGSPPQHVHMQHTNNNHGGSPFSKYLHMPADSQPKLNYMNIFNHITKTRSSLIDVGVVKAWKLKGLETFELQKTILQHEQLADHLLLKTHWKRQAILNKYRKEDGTPGNEPTYEEIHPECTLYQFGTLMSDNSTIRTKAIEEYKRAYLENGERAAKIVGDDTRVPEQEQVDYIKNPTRAIPISEVSQSAPFQLTDTKNLNHRFFFLLPSAPVVQRLNQMGPYLQAFEYIDIIKELADNVPTDLQNLIATNQNSFEIQDWICRKMFTRPQNNGFIGPSGIAKRRGVSYMDADFHPNPPPGGNNGAQNVNQQSSGAANNNGNGGGGP